MKTILDKIANRKNLNKEQGLLTALKKNFSILNTEDLWEIFKAGEEKGYAKAIRFVKKKIQVMINAIEHDRARGKIFLQHKDGEVFSLKKLNEVI